MQFKFNFHEGVIASETNLLNSDVKSIKELACRMVSVLIKRDFKSLPNSFALTSENVTGFYDLGHVCICEVTAPALKKTHKNRKYYAIFYKYDFETVSNLTDFRLLANDGVCKHLSIIEHKSDFYKIEDYIRRGLQPGVSFSLSIKSYNDLGL